MNITIMQGFKWSALIGLVFAPLTYGLFLAAVAVYSWLFWKVLAHPVLFILQSGIWMINHWYVVIPAGILCGAAVWYVQTRKTNG